MSEACGDWSRHRERIEIKRKQRFDAYGPEQGKSYQEQRLDHGVDDERFLAGNGGGASLGLLFVDNRTVFSYVSSEVRFMSRLAIAFVLALASVAANSEPERPLTAAVSRASEARPFLFDGRMIGDARLKTPSEDNHLRAGAIVMPPNAGQPERER